MPMFCHYAMMGFYLLVICTKIHYILDEVVKAQFIYRSYFFTYILCILERFVVKRNFYQIDISYLDILV